MGITGATKEEKMRYSKRMVGMDVVITLQRYRNEESYPVDVRGTIEKVGRGIAKVRYQVPWMPSQDGYTTYLDGSENYVSAPF